MDNYRETLWPLPVVRENASGNTRTMGIELEFAGLDIDRIAEVTADELGGKVDRVSDYEYFVRDTEYGDFGVELDFQYLKNLGRERDPDVEIENLEDLAESALALLARQIVPFEIVGPPMPVNEIWRLESLVARLREEGAKGTGHAALYAFGLHLNPEVPDLEASTIANYLRAFLVLFEWLKMRSKVDLSRRMTPHIDPFPRDYCRLVCEEGYQPDMAALIDDYLELNPTRNRVLDMLPLFREIDEQRVVAVVDDERVKPRPTFHYRLPNCKIDEPGWGLVRPWRDWLQVEALAARQDELEEASSAYLKYLQNPADFIFGDWARTSSRWIIPELL